MNLRSLHGTERMRELFFVELGCSLRFGRMFLSLLHTVVYVINCTDRTAYLKCLSAFLSKSL